MIENNVQKTNSMYKIHVQQKNLKMSNEVKLERRRGGIHGIQIRSI